jgi:ATP-dependent exoDNAse (exonuclease V) beta subunit
VITFDPDTHTYKNIETSENYISVTTLLGKYKPKFDEDYHAERIAKREGVDKSVILEEWDRIRTKSTDKGTLIHNLLEEYIKTKTINNKIPWLFSEFDKLITENIPYIRNMHSELLLYDHNYKIAGTSDIVVDSGKYFHIVDFKTNKKFSYFSKYNEYFYPPVEHLSECEFNVYSLQLSMYGYMYEKISGKRLKSMFVMFLRPDKKTFDVINMNYLKNDVKQIFENYKLNSDKKCPLN